MYSHVITKISQISLVWGSKSVQGALPSYTHHNEYLSLETNTSRIIVLSFDHRVCFITEYPWEVKRSVIFTQERLQEGEKHGFLYAGAKYYLQPNTVGQHYA